MELEVLKRAVARVTTPGAGPVSGTAFFIGGNYMLTALHVVAASTKGSPVFRDKVTLTFPDGHETGATVVAGFWDISQDWAILECEDPPNASPIELLTAVAADTEWRSFGYPEIQPEGMTLRGRITDPNARYERIPAIELSCDEAEAGSGARLHGFSGAPCLVNGAAAGVLRSTLVEEVIDGARKRQLHTVAGRVYATSSRAIVDSQVARGLPRLPGSWSPLPIQSTDFLVFLSTSEGKYKKLDSVAKAAQQRLERELGPPYMIRAESVFANREVFLTTVTALCRAKVVVFDATGFEPAIMLLAGVRSVVKRGATILSVGRDYALGDALAVPFNVTDANIVAHSKKQADQGPEPVTLLTDRIGRALREMQVSAYVDNNVYEAVRTLPEERRGVIPKNEGVLVLCPFTERYNADVWDRRLRPGLQHQLELMGGRESSPDRLGVSRSFELNSPRLVTRALYEYIRRAQACIVDLTHWSENVLFELGVRVAASREGTSCLLARNWQADAPELEAQCRAIAALFVHEDGLYNPDADWEDDTGHFANVYGRAATLPWRTLADGTVHQTIAAALNADDEPASRPVYQDLMDSAKLFGKVPGKNSKPVGLYPQNAELVAREEQAEFERLLTAWFHLYYLYSGTDRNEAWKSAAGHVAVTLLERHVERIQQLSDSAGDELRTILSALAEAVQ